MTVERRGFFKAAVALSAGVGVWLKSRVVRAEGLPSDLDASKKKADPEAIDLPGFDKNNPTTLEAALIARKTSRNFDNKTTLTPEQLSRLLWAANGANRKDGHRTTPSAMARYPVDVLIALPEGVFRYDLEDHRLIKKLAKDLRGEVPIQPDFKKAAAILLYVVDQNRLEGMEMGAADLEIGCMVQNLFLEAAALGLGACVFGLIREKNVAEELGLAKHEKFRIAQAVGPLS